MNNRLYRVNSLLKKELSEILLKEIDFPANLLITITRAEASPNLREAKIYLAVMPEVKIEKVFQILNKKIYKIQQALNKRLKMRPIPKIVFCKEEATETAARVEQLLEKIKKNNG